MHDDAGRPAGASRYRTYQPPPEGFDPRGASSEELVRHGLPRRPDPEKEPQLARLWEAAFSRPVSYVKAELEVDPVMSSRDRLELLGPGVDANSNWGGIVVDTKSVTTDPAIMVFGQWVIPTVLELNPAGEAITVAFWVGIDGGFGGVGAQVVQAGIAATVTSSGVDYRAWTEWYTDVHKDPAHWVTNFPVGAGDNVSFLVCVPQPDFAQVTMLNHSRGLHTSVGIPAPAGVTSVGGTVEWVIEAASIKLPDFYAISFYECAAATETHLFDLSPHGVPVNVNANSSISAPWGYPLTGSAIESPTRANVYWRSFG